VSAEKAEAKAKRELAAHTKEKDSAATKETVQIASQPAANQKSSSEDTTLCSRQAWPYYSASCIDRSAPAPTAVHVTNTRQADPAVALRDDEKKQASAPEPARDTRPAAKTISAAPAPAQPAAPEPSVTPPAPTQAQTPARAPTTANSRAPDTARASTANVERQVEEPRQRQQPRGQPRYTRIDPPDDDDVSPRVFFRGDGTRVYVMPEGRVRSNNGYYRSW
jgi:hypothetical protein